SGGNNQPNNVHYLQGTSFSAPFVSGIAGLLLSAEPGLTNVQLWNILNMTAVQPVGSGYNTNYGWGVVNARNAIAALNQPLISVDSYPTSVSSSSTFGVTWSILGPAGMAVSDTHLVWGTSSGALGNATAAQSGQTRQSYTAGGLALPSGAGALYFKVVATVNGTAFSSREYTVIASSVPDFLYVLYQLLASNLLYLALFILVLAGVVAFIPQRRAARARRGRPPADVVSAELLRPGRAAVSAPARGVSSSDRDPANRAANRGSADSDSDAHRCAAGRVGDHRAARGRQEALPELRDDGQRGQHVLLLLREPVPLNGNDTDRGAQSIGSIPLLRGTRSRSAIRRLTSRACRIRTRTSASRSPPATSGRPAPSRAHGPSPARARASSRSTSRCNW